MNWGGNAHLAASRTAEHLTSGRLLARNAAWNLLGQGLPVVVALVSVPVLVKALGVTRFGVLALAWAVVGYSSVFDFGLGRALTQVIAHRLGSADRDEDVHALIRAALFSMLGIALVGGLALLVVARPLTTSVLRVPPDLRDETTNAFQLLALAVPAVIASTGFRGILEAFQRFDLSNAVRMPIGAMTFIGPVFVLPWSRNLAVVILPLLAVRIAGCAAYLVMVNSVLPGWANKLDASWASLWTVLRLGSWMTVSNVIGPVMVYLDRFVIGAVLSLAAVAYYATAYELVTRIWVIPAALVGVLFPAFATSMTLNPGRTRRLFTVGARSIFLAVFPVILATVTIGPGLLRVILGADLAAHATRPLQILAVGVLISSIAQVAFGLLQAAGRPDLGAKLHLIEVLPYLAIMWLLIRAYGIDGAAIAWTARVAVDALALLFFARRLIHVRISFRRPILWVILSGAMLTAGVQALPFPAEAAFLVGALLFFGTIAWLWLLDPHERLLLQNSLRLRRHVSRVDGNPAG